MNWYLFDLGYLGFKSKPDSLYFHRVVNKADFCISKTNYDIITKVKDIIINNRLCD